MQMDPNGFAEEAAEGIGGSSADVPVGDRIVSNPGICGGRPRIRGTRVRVSDILEMLAEGVTREEITADFPYIANEDIAAAIAYAARAVDHRIIHVG
jgi:uncharacterized protein (DUF433 family)